MAYYLSSMDTLVAADVVAVVVFVVVVVVDAFVALAFAVDAVALA